MFLLYPNQSQKAQIYRPKKKKKKKESTCLKVDYVATDTEEKVRLEDLV